MLKIFTATFFLLVCLVSSVGQAETFDYKDDPAAWSQLDTSEEDNMTTLARPRPRPTIYRCCAKPHSVYGRMNCRQGSDKLLTWSAAIQTCEYRYGGGACVSGCRRLNL